MFKSMFKGNTSVWIVSLIALVNMMGYGIVFPILYAYSKKFGLSDFQNGLLFAVFSVCQFIATPIIGRLSDKYGRRPMLIVSIIGTVISFFVMAWAPSAIFLFVARALDGLTAGNVPVIFAVISDTTERQERAKAFGRVGSAFSFGFIFGPAIAALTFGFGDAVPFIIAGVITLIAAVITAMYLPETNKHMHEEAHGPLFDFPKMWHTLFDPNVGATFIITLVFYLAFSCAVLYGFQPFTMNILRITESQNAMLFTLFGFMGLIAQSFLVERISHLFGLKRSFSAGIVGTALSFVIMFLSRSVPFFVLACIILAVCNSVVQTLIPTILSRESDPKTQGTIMGLNASYQSIGMIFGPILGGMVATYMVPLPFLVGGLLVLVCFFLSFQVLHHSK